MFKPETILLNCDLTDKEAIIRHLAQHGQAVGLVDNVEAYVQSVLHREAEYSTGVGYGIAIPHGKSSAVKEAFVIFTRVTDVDWQSLDGTPVDMVFQIGVPESDAGDQHLRILAQLSRKLMKDEFRQALREAASVEAVLATFKEYGLA